MSRLTVAFSTFRESRFSWVKQLLISLQNQTFGDFKVLLIVNHDRKYFNRLVNEIGDWKELTFEVNVVFNPDNLGIAHDRNIALKNANTPLIAFTDDDAFPHKDWLRMINDTFETYNSAGAVTGPILANWSPDSIGSKSWFPKELYWIIGCNHREYQSVQEVRNGFASNLALDREISLSCGGFDETFGYNQKYRMAGEEPELSMKLKKMNKLTLWNPQVIVYHRVTASRLKLKDILIRSYVEGRTKVYLERAFGVGTLAPEKEHLIVVTKALLNNSSVKCKIYLATSTSAVAIGYSLTKAKVHLKKIVGR